VNSGFGGAENIEPLAFQGIICHGFLAGYNN